MQAAIDSIAAALANDASSEAKRAGAAACRAVLSVLEPHAPNTVTPPAPPAPHVAALVAALRGMPMEQILDLAVAKLRSSLPAGAELAPVASLKLPIIPIPRKA